MKFVLAMVIVGGCGSSSSPPALYHCVPGVAASSALAGEWRQPDPNATLIESMTLQGSDDALCGTAASAFSTRGGDRYGVSGNTQTLRWDRVCSCPGGPYPCDPPCEEGKILDSRMLDVIQLDAGYIQLIPTEFNKDPSHGSWLLRVDAGP